MPAAAAASNRTRADTKGAGKALTDTERKLRNLGLVLPEDFVLHLPLRYEDETRVVPINTLRPGFPAQVEGEITKSEVLYRPRRQLTATLADESGELQLRGLNFYPSQQKQVSVGKRLRARGEVRGGLFGREMVHPRMTNADAPLPTALTPVYPSTEGLPQLTLRRAIAQALDRADLSDTLPDEARARYDLPPFEPAIRALHTPAQGESEQALLDRVHPAWRRIKFDELLAQQLSLAAARAARRIKEAEPQPARAEAGGLVARLYETLPFKLTGAQARVVAEISADLGKPYPMHRLLQGDVGSGKTVVAAIAAAQAIAGGAQVVLMAPTEILAEQHFGKLVSWLQPLGVNVAWLSGSPTAKARARAAAAAADGSVHWSWARRRWDPGSRGIPSAGPVHRRRAAPLRRRPAAGAHAQGRNRARPHRAAPAQHERHADSPHAGHDLLRRPGRVRHRRAAAGTHAGADQAGLGRAARRGHRPHRPGRARRAAGLLGLPAGRGKRGPGTPDGRGHLRGHAGGSARPAHRAGARAAAAGRESRRDAGVPRRRGGSAGRHHRDRSRCRRAQCLADDHRECRTPGPGAAAPVARAGGHSRIPCACCSTRRRCRRWRERLRAMFETSDGFEIARRDLEQRPAISGNAPVRHGAPLRFRRPETDAAIAAEDARDAAVWLRAGASGGRRSPTWRWMRGREDFLRT